MLVQVTCLLLTAVLAASAPQRNLVDASRPEVASLLGSLVPVRRDAVTANGDHNETQTLQLEISSPVRGIKASRVQTNQIDEAGNQFQTTTVIKNDGNTETIQRQVLELPAPVSIDGSEPSFTEDDQLENENSESGAAIFLNIEGSTAPALVDEPQNEKAAKNSDSSAPAVPALVLETQETDDGQLAIDEDVLSKMVAMVNALKFNSDVNEPTKATRLSEQEQTTTRPEQGKDIELTARNDARNAQTEVSNTGVEAETEAPLSAPKGEAHFLREEFVVGGNTLASKETISGSASSGRKSGGEAEKNKDFDAVKSVTRTSELQSQAEKQSLDETKSIVKIKEQKSKAEVDDPAKFKQSQSSPAASTSSGAFQSSAPQGEAHFERKEPVHNWDEIASGIKTKKKQNHNWESSKKAKSFPFEEAVDETLIASPSSDSRTVKIKPQNWEDGHDGPSPQWPPLMPYNFAFEVRDDATTNYQNRVEVVEDGVLRGSFSSLGADGVIRTVTYTDDGTSGFQIQTQEIPTDVIVVGSQDYKQHRRNEYSQIQQGQSAAVASSAYQSHTSISSGGQSSASSGSSGSSSVSGGITGGVRARAKEISAFSKDGDIGFSSSSSQGKSSVSSKDDSTSNFFGSTGEENAGFSSSLSHGKSTVSSNDDSTSNSFGSTGEENAGFSSSLSHGKSTVSSNDDSTSNSFGSTGEENAGFSSSLSHGKSTVSSNDDSTSNSFGSTGEENAGFSSSLSHVKSSASSNDDSTSNFFGSTGEENAGFSSSLSHGKSSVSSKDDSTSNFFGSTGEENAGFSSSLSHVKSSASANDDSTSNSFGSTGEENAGFSSSLAHGKSAVSLKDDTISTSGGGPIEALPTSLGNIHFALPSSAGEAAVAAGRNRSLTSEDTADRVPFSQQGSKTSASDSRASDAATSGRRRFSFSSSIRDRSSSKSVNRNSGSSRSANTRISFGALRNSAASVSGGSGSAGGVSSSDRRGKISSGITAKSTFAPTHNSKKSRFSIRDRLRRRKQGSFVRTKFASALRGKSDEESNEDEEESRESQGDEYEEESREGQGNENKESREDQESKNEEESREGQGNENEESHEGQGTENEEKGRGGQENNSKVEFSEELENEETDEDTSTDNEKAFKTGDEGNESNTEQSKGSKELKNSEKFTVSVPSIKISSFSRTGSLKNQISSVSSASGRGTHDSEVDNSASDVQDLSKSSGTSSGVTQFVSGRQSSIIGRESPVTFIFGSHSLSGDKLTEAIHRSQKLEPGQGFRPGAQLLSAIGPDVPVTVVLGNNEAAGSRTGVSQGVGTQAKFFQLSSSGAESATGASQSSSISASPIGVESSSGSTTIGSAKQVVSSAAEGGTSDGVASKVDTSTGASDIEKFSSSELSSGSKQVTANILSGTSDSGTVTLTSKAKEASTAVLLSPVGSESGSSQATSGSDSSFTEGSTSVSTSGSGSSFTEEGTSEAASGSGNSFTAGSSSVAGQKSTSSISVQKATASSSASASSTKSSTLFHPTQGSGIVTLKPLSVISSVPVSSSGPSHIFATNLASGSGARSSSTSISSAGISKSSGSQSGSGSHSLSNSVSTGVAQVIGGAPLSTRKPVFIIPSQQTPTSNSVLILPGIGGSIFKETGTSGAGRGGTTANQLASVDAGTQFFGQEIGQSITRGSGVSSSSGISVFSEIPAFSGTSSSRKSSTGSSTLQEFLSGGSSGSTKSSVFRLQPASFREKEVVPTSSGGNFKQVSPIIFGGGGRFGFGSNFNSFTQNFPLSRPQIRFFQPSGAAASSHGNNQQISTAGATGDNGFSIVKATPGILRLERPLNFAQTQLGEIGNVGQLVVDQGVFGLSPTGNPNQLFITANTGKQLGGSSSLSSSSRSHSSRLSNFKPSISLEDSISRGLRPSVPASIAFGKTFPSFSGTSRFGPSQF